jgi:hypothetical protein
MHSKSKNNSATGANRSSNDNFCARAHDRAIAAAQALRAAVHQQREVCRENAESIAKLRTAIQNLKGEWLAYDRVIKSISVKPLRAKALRLARLMDAHLVSQST